MGAQAAHFFENALHLEFGLQTLERTIDWLTFTDLNFGHDWTWGGLRKRAVKVWPGGKSSTSNSNGSRFRLIDDLLEEFVRIGVEFFEARFAT